MEEKMEDKKSSGFKFKPIYIVPIVIMIGVIIGVIYLTANSTAGPVVAAGDNISVYYTGKLTNGTVFDSNFGKEPLNFTAGSNQLIEGFSEGVIGMKLNQTINITIPANQAYGQINPDLIIDVPRSEFGNQSISIGMLVSSSSGGEGTVTAVNATSVQVNFNSPLAGQTLIFEIKVIAIHKK